MSRDRRALVRIAKYPELLHIFDQCDAEVDPCSALGLVQWSSHALTEKPS